MVPPSGPSIAVVSTGHSLVTGLLLSHGLLGIFLGSSIAMVPLDLPPAAGGMVPHVPPAAPPINVVIHAGAPGPLALGVGGEVLPEPPH